MRRTASRAFLVRRTAPSPDKVCDTDSFLAGRSTCHPAPTVRRLHDHASGDAPPRIGRNRRGFLLQELRCASSNVEGSSGSVSRGAGCTPIRRTPRQDRRYGLAGARILTKTEKTHSETGPGPCARSAAVSPTTSAASCTRCPARSAFSPARWNSARISRRIPPASLMLRSRRPSAPSVLAPAAIAKATAAATPNPTRQARARRLSFGTLLVVGSFAGPSYLKGAETSDP